MQEEESKVLLEMEKHKKHKKKEKTYESNPMETAKEREVEVTDDSLDTAIDEGIVALKKNDKKKKKKKNTRTDETTVVEPADKLRLGFEGFHMDNAMEKDEAVSRKHEKKKKEKEFEVLDGSEGTSGMRSVGSVNSNKADLEKNEQETELEIKKDNNRKKRKGTNSKGDMSSFLPELCLGKPRGVSDTGETVKDIKKSKTQKSRESSSCKVDGGSAHANEQTVESASERKKRSDKELELEENLLDHVKERKKEMSRSSKWIESNSVEASNKGSVDGSYVIAGDKGRVHDEDHQGKGKRKRRQDSIEPEKYEKSSNKKAKKASDTEAETVKDGLKQISSTRTTSDEKSNRKKEKKGEQNDKQNLSLGATADKENLSMVNSIVKTKKAAKDMINEKASSLRKERSIEDSNHTESRKKSRRVSFSEEVQVFPPSNETNYDKDGKEGLIQGKRFTPEEDEMVKQAVLKYIEMNQLGEKGLHMVLNCKSFPQVKGCWKEIGASLSWRPYIAVYYRAHILFQRSQKREWDPEELEILRRHHAQHGSDWKTLAEMLGKHRFHVKDAWRRIKLLNLRRGKWSQDEYQTLFDLVNLDLRMKASEEKKSKHGMLRDNISWEAISEKLSTRINAACCVKWYQQLTSPLVSEGLWADSDDYRLLDVLQNLDACCVEDVDWDNLLEHRSGNLCRKRWNEMVRHIGGHQERSFIEQVEVLCKRYCPEMLEYRK